MENSIEVEGLVKNFGQVRAVKGISFSVERGSLFSFLGVNGAGKSTTINILCSILKKDAGRIRICGMDADKHASDIRARMGVVFQGGVLDDILTVRENLAVRASYYGLRGEAWRTRLRELSALLSLDELLPRPYGKLSGGQRRRADIARGLLNRPELLVLDEPTTGLDPQTRKAVWEIVRRLQKEQGMTVFLTTHYMEEADGSDRVVILDGGRIVERGTPLELKNRHSSGKLRLYGDAHALSAALAAKGIAAERVRGGVAFACTAAQARDFLRGNEGIFSDFEYTKGSMDDVFLAVTGRRAEGGGV